MDEIQRNFRQSGSDSVRCLRGGISVQLTAGEPDLLQCSECAAGCVNLFYVAADGAKSPENRGEKGQEAQNLLCGSDQLPVCLVHGHGISAAESGNDGLRSPGQRDDPDPCAVLKCCRISFCKSVA